jgi:DNA invertase Pin-like site-specific DNA recombinase
MVAKTKEKEKTNREMIRGYARVSTESQEVDAQVCKLKQYKCDQIYADVMSGTKRSRPELDRMIADLQPGDSVVIWKLDRLGRSVQNLIELVNLFKKKQVHFISLTDAIDTTTAAGMMMFHVISAVAQMERDLISERTKSTLAYKKSQGVRLGRPVLVQGQTILEIRELHKQGMRVQDIQRALNVSRPTIYKIIKAAN